MSIKIYKVKRFSCLNGIYGMMKDAEYFTIPHRQKFIIYVPLKSICALVNSEFVRNINNLNELAIKNFFNFVEKSPGIVSLLYDSAIHRLTLSLTDTCNMKCTYCYAAGGERPYHMPWATAKTAIRWAVANCAGEFCLHFLGSGEPTCAFELMKKCYSYAQELCKGKAVRLSVSCATNGVMDAGCAHWLAEIGAMVRVSLDGPPEIQNEQRPLRTGAPSYPYVIRTINLFNELKVKYCVVCTLTPTSVNKLHMILEHFKSLGIPRVEFDSCVPLGRSTSLTDVDVLRRNYAKALKHAGKMVTTYNMKELGNPLFIRKRSCGSTTALMVATDGYISPCYLVTTLRSVIDKRFIVGKIDRNRVKIDKKKFEQMRLTDADKLAECRTCFAKWNCGCCCPNLMSKFTNPSVSYYTAACNVTRTQLRDNLYRLFMGNFS